MRENSRESPASTSGNSASAIQRQSGMSNKVELTMGSGKCFPTG